ncbi:MAG TPA: tRNA (adenine-N1)-methyltransferase [Anaerolineales bacterium]|nr:tRNA (adenine-N1)-methyltransferase [Anaerolineales bacterium]
MRDRALVHPGDLVLLIDAKNKLFIFRLEPGRQLQTHRGVLRHDDLVGVAWGASVRTHLGEAFQVLSPTLHDLLLHLRRSSQIIFPKELGYILLRLSAGAGSRVVEAGTGSGALTLALAWSVGAEGRVFSYDRRADMQSLARRNLEQVGLETRVTFHEQDIEAGFGETDVDALFLDLPDPHLFLPQVRSSLRPGSPFGAILPTANQVAALLTALDSNGFAFVEVCEILLRFYKTVPQRLRPVDRMVAHTGYLVFARPLLDPPHLGEASLEPEGEP